jgi:hypothetical protein
MKRIAMFAVILGLAAMALAVQFIPNASANNDDNQGATFTLINRDAVAYGRTYGEWMAAWNQWSYSLPIDQHPLFTDGDCSVGQSGPVWFLGGGFVAPSTRVRHCTIPVGKALFLPVVDWEDSALEESVAENPGSESYQQIATMRSFVSGAIETALNPYLQIDGKYVPNLQQRFRIQSTVFGFTIPTNNLLNPVYGRSFPAGTYYPAIDDGWDVMIAPLSPGDHLIHFGSSFNDITYHIHVGN